ncbi:endonuclease-reverse transcriptase [Elysia marginata]|uniref:Endonuclease-reverse transcriptase n=1 Tax=Elysia marginata TaxID=1093978 RepID=A0AAV4EYF1_9GAST|nr:endonuclease-reverse transcriptase [Elysia marginata]
MASFQTRSKNINMNIVQIYAPTNEAQDEEKDAFYDLLQEVMDKLPKKDINILMGDANAKIGRENTGYDRVIGSHGLGEMNDNGERFANFCLFNKMVIGGSIFPHKRVHKATWVSPDNVTENQIDHFCVSQRFRRSLNDVIVQRGADIGSDHHMLLGKLKLRLKKQGNRKEVPRKRYQVNRLNGATKEDFKLCLRNRFQPLASLEEEEDVETHWSRVKSAFTATCEEVLGYQKKEYKEWISQKSLDLIERRRHLKEQVNSSRTRRSKEEKMEQFNLTAKEVKVLIKKDKESFTKTLAEKAEKAATAGHIKIIYQTTKTLVGKYTRSEMPVKDAGGKAIFEKDAQAARWIEHFTSLLNRPPPTNPPEILEAKRDLPINCDTPSHREIVDAIKQLNQGKAAGPDLIPPEALKADVDTTATFLCPLFAKVWTSGKYPMDWKEGHLVKIPKKGDLSRCENY